MEIEFESERLSFRQFNELDFADAISLSTNELVTKMITGKAATLEEAKLKFQKILRQNKLEATTGYFCVHLKNVKPSFIGLGKIIPTENEVAEIGYSILPEFWGKGYGTEICLAMVNRAKLLQSFKILIALIDPENIASKKILEKCGFKFKSKGTWNGLPSATYQLEV